jgi:transposase
MRDSNTKKVKHINKKTLIVTLDIGKMIHYGYLRAPNGEEVTSFSFHNCRDGFNGFWDKVCQFKKSQKLKDVVVGFESTGPYAEPLFHFLRNKPVHLVQVNPLHSKKLKELTGNSPCKTDKKDPRVIADIISLGHALTLVVPEGAAAHLRRLTQARERAIQRRTAMLNQLQHLVFVLFPEFLSIIKDVHSKSALYLLQHYPAPQSIIALGSESLTSILRRVSRGKVTRERARKLFEAAQTSVGITEGRESILVEVKHLIAMIEHEDQLINGVEQQMGDYVNQIPYSRSMLSIKGMGIITVAGLIGEVGDFNKFRTIAEIMKLAGLDLYEVSSGNHRGRHHISKRGRALMRKLLYFASLSVVRKKGIMHEDYQKMLARGMPKIKALVAISRKLLRLVFALARDHTVYVNNYNHVRALERAA